MAKYRLDYLVKKYPGKAWSGKTYEALMTDIIAHNSERVARKTAEISQKSFEKVISRVKGEKRFILPNISNVLPKQSVFIRKGAETGKLLKDTLRDKLTNELRAALVEYGKEEPSMVQRRGVGAGRVSPGLIKRFRQGITRVFENYTKKDPSIGVPRNIKAIAVTELRSTINDIKHQYVHQLEMQNPDYKVVKRWIHNGHLVKEPRPGHVRLAGQNPIPADQHFKIPVYRKVGGRYKFMREYLDALHPHAPGLPPEEVINCNCDSEYFLRHKATNRRV